MTSAFEKACPHYLSMGMSWELFWHGPAEAVKHYREKDRLDLKRADALAWLQGKYVYDAMLRAAPPFQTFSKTHRAHPYNEAPYEELAERREREKTLAQRLSNGELVAKKLAEEFGRWKEKNGGLEHG